MSTEASAQSTGGLDGYERFLGARDGTPDRLRHTLSRRETLFESLGNRPIGSAYRPDRARLLANFGRTRPQPGLDRRRLWLLAAANSNQAERYSRAEWSRRPAGFDIDEFIGDCPDTAHAAARI